MTTSRTWIGVTTLSYLILTTIGFAQVNSESLFVFPLLRQLAIIVCVISLVFALIHRGFSASLIFPVIITTWLYAIAFVRSAETITLLIKPGEFFVDVIIILFGVIVLSLYGDRSNHSFIRRGFLTFSISVFLFLVLTGGITLLPFPAFNFDILADERSLVVATYGQGPSKFFGIMTIFAVWQFIHSTGWSRIYFFLPVIVSGILLSFLGGGRGEFIFLALTILAMASLGAPLKRVKALWLTVALVVFLGIVSADALAQTSAFARFYALWEGNGFSKRDVLFSQSIHLLITEPSCFYIGCGFGFFQSYYNYSYGLYPHNLLLESFMVWGAVIIVPLLGLFISGVSEARRRLGPIFWVGAYVIGIGLKSGDVIGSWGAISIFVIIASEGAERLFNKKGIRRYQRVRF